MFQTIQTIYFLKGYDPGNMSVSFIAELSPVLYCQVHHSHHTRQSRHSHHRHHSHHSCFIVVKVVTVVTVVIVLSS